MGGALPPTLESFEGGGVSPLFSAATALKAV